MSWINTGKNIAVPTNITAILLTADSDRAINNDVVNTVPPTGLLSVAIGVEGGIGGVVEGNRINNSTQTQGGSFTYGILFIGTSSEGLAVNNRIAQMSAGVQASSDIPMAYRDNLTIGVTFPFVGGSNAGNNQSF